MCLLLAMGLGRAETVPIDVQSKYGITLDGIAHAIEKAKSHFAQFPNDVIILDFPPGKFDLTHAPSHPEIRSEMGHSVVAISLDGVKPGPSGRLVFHGAGSNKTTLLFARDMTEFEGRGVYHVTVSGFHLASAGERTTQGHVVSVSPGIVVLDIQDGFPTPAEIFNSEVDQGRFLRRFTDSKTDPQMIQDHNTQVAWVTARQISGQRWKFNLKGQDVAPYSPGNLIGVKSKVGGQAYYFSGGSDFTFNDILWTQESCGDFRGGFDDVKVLNCEVKRSPPINGQTPCLSSPSGGPQIGQPRDPPTTGNVVDNYTSEGTGDDSIAFFNASGTINNVTINDSFARGILLYHSPSVKITNAKVERCPILYGGKGGRNAKPSEGSP